MFEKVNPAHPDKVADRIAGAIVDLAYKVEKNPRIAVEVLIGHRTASIISETSVHFETPEIAAVVRRIAGDNFDSIRYIEVPQDVHLAENQIGGIRCGDNGIFRGVPVTEEQERLTWIAQNLYEKYRSDGKYILDTFKWSDGSFNDNRLIICQSNAHKADLKILYPYAEINPLGGWTGGTDVDTGATNRKLGSDMGDSMTGGGLHGKDLSKADVSVNIYAWLLAQEKKKPVEMYCAIGDERVSGIPYSAIVEVARDYINSLGGFEKFAEWGLIR